MTRGVFTGSKMGGGTVKKKRSATEMYMAHKRGETADADQSPEERYKKIFEEKLEELRKKAAGGGFSSAPPGTQMAPRKLSASAQKTIDDMINKRAKKYAKEKSRVVKVVPKRFTGMQGGRIDNRGAIFGPDGRWIATVDKKTGKVRSRRGFVVCKYDPKSSVCEFRIASFIANEYRTRRGSLYKVNGHSCVGYGIYGQAGAMDNAVFDDVYGHHDLHGNVFGGGADPHAGGSVWGNSGDHGGGGSVWGDGGGGIWGNGGH